ncbi:MAG: tRNA (guanosine(18)-2'-O)-methyltransferase [Ignavibacteriaceae bacterium]|nr:RNA methyltransferase [Ignavibacteriaceae bacterium]MEB2295231.1 RNA methyltransferase [Ignavibacteria bacterium]GIK61404.1 MAG: tRNA (guanosine(18)-2'-O)-methyltransferase [Ignavibacteriota bacterium]GJQ42575.1 MAG: tRNA (guanosine(18)-2'-O)-methyltransferase [Ignavibacteriaceae bacterium]
MSDSYFRTEKRIEKIKWVLSKRQPSLRVVLENIHDPHNVSAIFRTCDAAGVPKVSLVYNVEKFPKIGKKSSASAYKWIEREKYKSIEDCYSQLREEKFVIYASSLNSDSKSLYDLDFTKKTAIVFGNEHRGLSNEAEKLADERFFIPMYGMVQSLNVSVSAAICIYEALRQRLIRKKYDKSELSTKELKNLLDEWSKK